ncbi:MAG: PAS domain S-box protein [Armatimonadetes bacterium]|nr:PAS domain S-box protein [Armatimonadota bacterium]
MNLTPRITFAFVLFAAALLAGVGWLSYQNGRTALQASATSELLSAAIQKETKLNGWVDERLADLAALAELPVLRADVARLAAAPDSPVGRAAHDRLILSLRPSIERVQYLELFVLDPATGKVLASTKTGEAGKSKIGDPYFENGKLGSYVKNPYQSAATKEPAMTISTPVRSSQRRLSGVLVARLDLDALDSIIGQRTGLRRSDDAYLVNPTGQFVTQPRFANAAPVFSQRVDTEAVRRVTARNSGVTLAPDYRNVPVISVYRWIPTRQLGLLVEIDQEEAFAPASAFGRTILLISVLALLIASLVAFELAQGITRPLRALQDGVARFGRGDLDTRLPDISSDEVGLLAREFNAMASAIASKEAQLHESEQSMRLMVESVRDYAILMLDPKGHVASWNAGAERFKGYTAQEIIGQYFSRFYTPEDIAAGKPEMNLQVAQAEDRSEDEGWRVRKDGSMFWASVVITAVRDEAGELRGFSKVTRDITERKAAQEEMLKAQEQILQAYVNTEQRVVERTAQLEAAKREVEHAARANRNMMEHSRDVICSIDAQGRFMDVSPACHKVWGYSPEELSGRFYIDLVHPDDVEKTNQVAAAIMNGDPADNFENRYLCHDGSVVDILWSAVWSDAEQSMFCVARDISERKRAEEELRAAKVAAEEASLAKSQFLANMSHEIRTPMNGVLGPIGLLLDSKLSTQQRELTEIARSSAESLLAIINDILDLSKIEVGRLEIEPIPFDLLVAVEETAAMMIAKSQEKGLDLIVRFPPEVPRHVIGDPGRIRQVLANLVANAVKFTAQGHILINVEAQASAELGVGSAEWGVGSAEFEIPSTPHSALPIPHSEVLLRFSVEDSGIGIAPDKIDHIFGRFNQADTSTTRRYGGTGLGLSISRQLVELMGGEIGVQSVVGQGSTFSFALRLPLQSDVPNFAVPDANLSGVRVLIVDDNAINRRVLHEQLDNWNLRNASSATAADALKTLREARAEGDPFQIAILDFQMPDSDGEMLGRAIKTDPELRDTILMMLTSLGHQGEALRIKTAGFAAYLLKPARQSELLSALVSVWSARDLENGSQPLPRHDLGGVAIAHSGAAKTWEGTRVLLAEDNIVNQKVATLMLGSYGCRVEVAANGREALRMLDALPFDLIFMDCEMPEMDGFEATAQIRRRGDEKNALPIIAVTAKATRGDREFCLQAGMDDYISKPVKAEDFRAALERWAPRAQGSRRGEGEKGREGVEVEPATRRADSHSSSPPLPFSPSALDGEVVARLRDLAAATDTGLLKQIFESFVGDGAARLAALEGAVENGDAIALYKASHVLKGASANIGARRMAEICGHLQSLGEAGRIVGAAALVAELRGEFDLVRAEISAELEKSL